MGKREEKRAAKYEKRKADQQEVLEKDRAKHEDPRGVGRKPEDKKK